MLQYAYPEQLIGASTLDHCADDQFYWYRCSIVNCPPRENYPGTVYNIFECPWVIFACATVYNITSLLNVLTGNIEPTLIADGGNRNYVWDKVTEAWDFQFSTKCPCYYSQYIVLYHINLYTLL